MARAREVDRIARVEATRQAFADHVDRTYGADAADTIRQWDQVFDKAARMRQRANGIAASGDSRGAKSLRLRASHLERAACVFLAYFSEHGTAAAS